MTIVGQSYPYPTFGLPSVSSKNFLTNILHAILVTSSYLGHLSDLYKSRFSSCNFPSLANHSFFLYLNNCLLTTQCRALLKKLIVVILVKKSLALYKNHNVHCRTHNSPPPDPKLNKMNSVKILNTLFKINFIISLPSTPTLKMFYAIHILKLKFVMHRISATRVVHSVHIALDFITLILFGEDLSSNTNKSDLRSSLKSTRRFTVPKHSIRHFSAKPDGAISKCSSAGEPRIMKTVFSNTLYEGPFSFFICICATNLGFFYSVHERV